MEDQTKQSNGNEEDLSGFFFDSDDEERKQIEQSESSKSESSSLKKEDVKQDALEYWKIKANRLGNSIEAMLLIDDRKKAKYKEKFNNQELLEITSNIPKSTFQNKRVIDIGAGIGRYTNYFAKNGASHVSAVDFVADFIEKNKQLNSHLINESKTMSFVVSDVRDLKYEKNSFDLIFSNWLLMYINDQEVEIQLDRFHQWLSQDGFLFFRESCETTLSGLQGPAAHYRKKIEYDEFLRRFDSKFELVGEGNMALYVKKYNNPNQRWWLLKKRV